ncbi:MAG: hypothetical protein HY525_05535 [Betaproteobacteria bacterium]|nr:hypothetical protein [Betaproteobacteria bacterium]
MLVVLAAATQPAAAGPWRDFGGGRFDVQAQRQRPGGAQRQPQRDFRRERPERDKRGDDRLTEEERRELRRDIERANREIYKGRR